MQYLRSANLQVHRASYRTKTPRIGARKREPLFLRGLPQEQRAALAKRYIRTYIYIFIYIHTFKHQIIIHNNAALRNCIYEHNIMNRLCRDGCPNERSRIRVLLRAYNAAIVLHSVVLHYIAYKRFILHVFLLTKRAPVRCCVLKER